MRRNPDERLRRRARDLAAGAGTMDDRLAQEAAILRTEGLAWRTRVPHFLGVEWDSNEDPLVTLDNDRKAHDDRGVIERYLVNKLILGDYDQREAWLLFLGLTQKHRRRLMIRQGPSAGMFGQAWGGRAANEFLARFLDEARAMWTPDDLGFVLARPLVDPWPLVPAGVQRDWKKLGLDVFKGMPRQNPSPDQRRRELERRAALGDPEAAAQLEAMIHRAPATPGEAIEAGDPVRLAWQAWQEGRGTLGEYEAARYVAVSSDTRATSYPWLGSAGAARRIPDQMRGFSPEAYSAIVLDTPQADAVLQAYTAATGKPWNTALTIGRGGPGTGFEGWRRGQKPTVKQAAQVVVAYYRSLGWAERPGMPGTTSGKQLAHAPLVSPDGQQRVVFSRTTLRRERRDGSRWVRDYSRDPTDQVGIMALAEALMRRALRAKDWRTNPPEVDGSYVLQPPGATGQIGPERGSPVRNGIAKFVSPHGSVRFVAYQAGNAVGGLQVVVAAGRAPVVAMAYVLPGHRRTGVASRLWARAKKDCPGVVHAAESDRSQDAAAWISSLPNPSQPSKTGRAKSKCDRCFMKARSPLSQCCGWHTCARCMGDAPPNERGVPLCRWCVRHRQRLDELRAREQQNPGGIGPTICAWCPLYGRPPAVIVPGDPAQPASHGLCAACKADMKAGRATGAPGSPAP